jgi:hypothetical protein
MPVQHVTLTVGVWYCVCAERDYRNQELCWEGATSSLDVRRLHALCSSAITVPAAPTGTAQSSSRDCNWRTTLRWRAIVRSVAPKNLARMWSIGIETAETNVTCDEVTFANKSCSGKPAQRQYIVTGMLMKHANV